MGKGNCSKRHWTSKQNLRYGYLKIEVDKMDANTRDGSCQKKEKKERKQRQGSF